MKVHSCIVQLTLAACVALPGLAAAAPIAYVPNEGSGTISIIDTAKDTVVETVAVGKKPRGIAISGNWLYVSDQLHNSLQLVNLKTRKLGPAIALGKSPEGVYASADGQWVAAAIEENDEVAIVDTKSRSVAFRIRGWECSGYSRLGEPQANSATEGWRSSARHRFFAWRCRCLCRCREQ
jgi:YVTN family beta-propeller protein